MEEYTCPLCTKKIEQEIDNAGTGRLLKNCELVVDDLTATFVHTDCLGKLEAKRAKQRIKKIARQQQKEREMIEEWNKLSRVKGG